VISLLEFLIDNVFVSFGGTMFQQVVGIPMGTTSAYLLQAFEETPTHMSIKINRLEEGYNSYPLVCRRPAETVSLQRRQTCLKIFWIT
jgi:hypothetical protein